ncbi:MAG: hypothetical protein PWQ09_500 [Candidatus Cloacimonadota bacterium]|jgi:hypothetical protein|nr:hypothetical protein [Candidatus Cloacimonadota bacterium]
MNRRIFIITFLILHFTFFIGLSAQDTWINTYQPFGDVDYYPEDIVVCSDSGYAVNGYYSYYDPEFGIDEQWGFLIKVDTDGNFEWAKRDMVSFLSQTRSNAFVETSDGGFISIGWNNVNINYIIKRDSWGNKIWENEYDFGVNSMCNSADGNIVLGGRYNGIGLRKIDNDGNEIWTKSFQINENYAVSNSVIQTNDGGYALTGYGYFDDDSHSDIFVIRADSNGDSLWARIYDGYETEGKSITEDSDGNLMIAGELDDSNSIVGFLWYLDEDGNTLWTQEVESSVGYSHYSVLSIPNGSFTTICQTSSGAKLYNYDVNYFLNWDNVFTGWSGRGDKPIRILQNIGYICCLERVGGIMEDNIGIAKTDSQGQVVSIDEFEIPNINDISLTNYPNPFNPETKIIFNLPATIENPIIEIFNIKGERVRTINYQNQIPIVWDGTDKFRNQVSSGIYLYRLKTNNFVSKVKKMTLLK